LAGVAKQLDKVNQYKINCVQLPLFLSLLIIQIIYLITFSTLFLSLLFAMKHQNKRVFDRILGTMLRC